MYFNVLFTFKNIEKCKVKVRLKLGFFSDVIVLKICLKVNAKVWVRLKLG